MKILFLLSILSSLGMSKLPCYYDAEEFMAQVCKLHLVEAVKHCDNNDFRRIQISMSAFYNGCITDNEYTAGSNSTIERTAMACLIRSKDQTLTQKQAEAIAESEVFNNETFVKYKPWIDTK